MHIASSTEYRVKHSCECLWTKKNSESTAYRYLTKRLNHEDLLLFMFVAGAVTLNPLVTDVLAKPGESMVRLPRPARSFELKRGGQQEVQGVNKLVDVCFLWLRRHKGRIKYELLRGCQPPTSLSMAVEKIHSHSSGD